jgi:hypothetical protein
MRVAPAGTAVSMSAAVGFSSVASRRSATAERVARQAHGGLRLYGVPAVDGMKRQAAVP